MGHVDYAAFARACATNDSGGVRAEVTREIEALSFLTVLGDELSKAVVQMNADGRPAELIVAAYGRGFTLRRDLARFVSVILGSGGKLDTVGAGGASIEPPKESRSLEDYRAAARAHVQEFIRVLWTPR